MDSAICIFDNFVVREKMIKSASKKILRLPGATFQVLIDDIVDFDADKFIFF